MNAGIYQIINLKTGGCYVGSAVNIRQRWNSHRRRLRFGTHHTGRLQAAWDEYGEGAFEFAKLLVCSPDNLIMYEQRTIDVLKPEYNVRLIARSNLGVKYSAESRARMSAALKGNRNTLGYRHTEEARANMSRSKMGQQPMLGRSHSDETKAKMSKALRGRRHTRAAREKMSNTKKGVPLKPEVLAARIERLKREKMAGNHVSS